MDIKRRNKFKYHHEPENVEMNKLPGKDIFITRHNQGFLFPII